MQVLLLISTGLSLAVKLRFFLSAFSEESHCCAHHHAEAELRVVEVTCVAVKWNNAEFGHVTVEKLAIQ